MKLRTFVVSISVSMVVLTSGCAVVAPAYSPSMDNVSRLKNAGEFKVGVGEFATSKSAENENPISIRGSSMTSPVDGSYARYLAEALKVELELARKLSPASQTTVSGELLKNGVDASGFSTGKGDIAARFVVKKSGQTRYEQVKSVHHEWESSFAGAVAIPKATQEYPVLVQKLIGALFNDNAFIEALK